MNIRITPYQPEFQQDVLNLILLIQQKEFHIPITQKDQPDLQDIQKFYDGFWIALNEKNEVVGTIGMMIIDDFVVTRKMFVSKDCRGLGVSKNLLDQFEQECLSRKISKIYLGTVELFKDAHHFYEKNGYCEILAEELPKKFPRMKVDTKFYFKKLY